MKQTDIATPPTIHVQMPTTFEESIVPPETRSRDEIRDDDRVSYILTFAMIALTALYLLTFFGVLGNFGRSPPEAAQEIGIVLSPIPSPSIERPSHDE